MKIVKEITVLALIFYSLAVVNKPRLFAEPQAKSIDGKEYSLAVADSLYKIFKFKSSIPSRNAALLYAARNEYEAFQILIDNVQKDLGRVRIKVSDLTGMDGKTNISNSVIEKSLVGYVPTRKPYYKTSYVGLWPDPLLEADNFEIKKGEKQVIWVTVYIPENVSSGEYKGVIEIIPENATAQTVPLNLRVWNFALPKDSHLKTAFDFYEYFVAKFFTRKKGEAYEDWKNRVREIIEAYYTSMLKYRLSPILNLDPLSEDFNKRITKYLDYGITAFGIGKYGGTFGNNWPKEDINSVIPLYKQYAQILKNMGILGKAYLYTWDEGEIGNPRVKEVTEIIHRADPGLKNMVCYHGFWDPDKDPGWGKDIDIWCFQIASYNENLKKKIENLGKEIWMYISGPGDVYPNFAIDFPAIDARIIPWMCWKYNIKGLLYWCVNFWRVNPWEDAMNTDWQQNGNGLLYYPGENGPVASLRLELIRDGIEDYEYLYLLNQKVKEIKQKGLDENNQTLINKAEALLEIDESVLRSLAEYTKNPESIYQARTEIAETIEALDKILPQITEQKKTVQVVEDFSKPITASAGKSFGDYGQLTFELFRKGTFIIDGKSGFAWQKSESYRDVAIIRSTKPLPKTYRVSVEVGEIDYGLDKIKGLHNDPEYKEGPLNENGCYLLAITDQAPIGHYTNDWWHKHRKVCIDVDNNIWGSGMPRPIFMVFFDKQNELMALNGKENKWQKKWEKALTYEPGSWYRVEIEKTENSFKLFVYDDKGMLLKGGIIPFKYVWNEDGNHPDYLVIGDPHENYYQGSMKIKSISMPVEIE